VSQDQIQVQRDRRRRSLAIGATVQAALRENRLLFAFQPVVCATTGEIDYFECLLRMRDEGGTIIGVGEFITTIEQLGLIGFIDRYVLEQAVQELASHPGIKLGLNVSSLTACDKSWLQSLISLLRNRPDIARRLVVEITETAALYDIDESARFVDTLRHAGCRVALDDFGAGHTSLRHLQILAIDTVKIDGAFVRNLAENPQNRIFLRHLLSLTKALASARWLKASRTPRTQHWRERRASAICRVTISGCRQSSAHGSERRRPVVVRSPRSPMRAARSKLWKIELRPERSMKLAPTIPATYDTNRGEYDIHRWSAVLLVAVCAVLFRGRDIKRRRGP
jgi:EAL domain-containing protein (putative c-di-GMP-specific phosphodiesterase class I)